METLSRKRSRREILDPADSNTGTSASSSAGSTATAKSEERRNVARDLPDPKHFPEVNGLMKSEIKKDLRDMDRDQRVLMHAGSKAQGEDPGQFEAGQDDESSLPDLCPMVQTGYLPDVPPVPEGCQPKVKKSRYHRWDLDPAAIQGDLDEWRKTVQARRDELNKLHEQRRNLDTTYHSVADHLRAQLQLLGRERQEAELDRKALEVVCVKEAGAYLELKRRPKSERMVAMDDVLQAVQRQQSELMKHENAQRRLRAKLHASNGQGERSDSAATGATAETPTDEEAGPWQWPPAALERLGALLRQVGAEDSPSLPPYLARALSSQATKAAETVAGNKGGVQGPVTAARTIPPSIAAENSAVVQRWNQLIDSDVAEGFSSRLRSQAAGEELSALLLKEVIGADSEMPEDEEAFEGSEKDAAMESPPLPSPSRAQDSHLFPPWCCMVPTANRRRGLFDLDLITGDLPVDVEAMFPPQPIISEDGASVPDDDDVQAAMKSGPLSQLQWSAPCVSQLGPDAMAMEDSEAVRLEELVTGLRAMVQRQSAGHSRLLGLLGQNQRDVLFVTQQVAALRMATRRLKAAFPEIDEANAAPDGQTKDGPAASNGKGTDAAVTNMDQSA